MNNFRVKHSFSFKLSLYTMTCIVITFLSVLVYNYYVSKNVIMKDIEKNVAILANTTLMGISETFNTSQQITEDISSVLENSKIAEKELLALLSDIVKNNYEINACTVSFEPYMFDKTKYYFSPYFYRDIDVIKYSDLSNDGYNYFKRDWYTVPKKLDKSAWVGPYFDEEGSDVLMVTYSKPFYKAINGKREFCGIVACDIHLDWLGKRISDIRILKSGFVFILSSKGDYIAHSNKNYSKSTGNIFASAEMKGDDKRKVLGEKMVNGQTGFEEYYSNTLKKKCFVYYTPLKEMGWALGVVIPKDELLADLNAVTLKLFIIGLIGYVSTLILIVVLASRITKPLRTLAGATCEIGGGDFNVKLPVISTSDEIGVLSRSFHVMQENLVKYINNLRETTAAKERIEKELSIARETQQSLLPHNFPRLKQFDLYATLTPAKEVGGDLYDFFLIDKTHLCFAIGDVSGKGVPAALFMAVIKTLLRAKVGLSVDPAKVLNAMNEDLCKENDSCTFVTFFLGVFNIETGILEYCNAGHNPPLVHTANRGFYFFNEDAETHPPLGIAEGVTYVKGVLKLLPEDIFFLYTDGVTEAMNGNNIQFSEEKLLNALTINKDEPLVNIVNNVKKIVEQHVSGAAQSDDMAMLIVKYNG